MNLPFTHDQFLDVFGAYNGALWPAALLLWLATLAGGILWYRRRAGSSRWISALLVLHWVWAGVAYHLLYFRAINPAAIAFGAAFLLEVVLLAWRGLVRADLTFSAPSSGRAVAGAILVVYSLVYPAVGLLTGLHYPRLPTFGVPCPTVILTAGLLLLVPPRQARVVAIIPILWAAIGSSAAFTLGIRADLALPVAGIALFLHIVRPASSGRGGGLTRPLLLYFLLAPAISWTLWAPLWLPALGVHGLPTLRYQHALGALGPFTAAFILTALDSGRAGVVDLLRRVVLWRGRIPWIVVALAAPLGILLLAVLVARLAGGEDASLSGFGVSREFPQLSALGLLVYNILTFGYGEETGWRGFALPRLQANHSALAATAWLTCGWAIWHIPLFLYRPGYAGMSPAGIAGWLFSLFTGALLLTWLYNGSRGSILVVALFHAAVDVVFTSDITSTFVMNAAGFMITILGLAVLLVAGPRYLSRTGKVIWPPGHGATATFLARAGR